LEVSAQDCLLDCSLEENLSCDQITPVCYGRLEDDTTVCCEDKIQVGVSILPLICWQGQGDGNKRSSCWDPKARSCHSKKSWLNRFELINKFVLPLEIVAIVFIIAVVTILVNRTTPNDPPLLKINQTTYHGGDYLPLASSKDSLLLFPIFSIALLSFPFSLND